MAVDVYQAMRDVDLWHEVDKQCREQFIIEVHCADLKTIIQTQQAFGWFVLGWGAKRNA